MLESAPVVILIGAVLGFLAGLGVGGGSLLILWLSVVLNTPHPTARVINLLFFIPSALCASFFRWKQGALELEKILPAAIAGCVAAAGFSLLGSRIDLTLLKKLFGALLLITGLREVFYRERNAR